MPVARGQCNPLPVGIRKRPPQVVPDDSLSATLPRFARSVHVGDRVKDKHSSREGVCLYVGPADFSNGKTVCGLRLDNRRTTTDCDGKYRGKCARQDGHTRAHTHAPALNCPIDVPSELKPVFCARAHRR